MSPHLIAARKFFGLFPPLFWVILVVSLLFAVTYFSGAYARWQLRGARSEISVHRANEKDYKANEVQSERADSIAEKSARKRKAKTEKLKAQANEATIDNADYVYPDSVQHAIEAARNEAIAAGD